MDRSFDINRSNYESFVIDYLDGNLSVEASRYFDKFLEDNPDIREEIQDLNDAILSPEHVEFEAKIQLKKKSVNAVDDINEDNYEEFFVASAEGDLNSDQNSNLEKFISANYHLAEDFNLYKILKLTPDNEVIFSGKEDLKQKRRITPMWYSSVAAAVILIFASLWFFRIQQPEIIREQSIAINKISNKKVSDIRLNEENIPIEFANRSNVIIPDASQAIENKLQQNYFASRLEPRTNNDWFVDASDYKRIIVKQYNIKVVNETDFAHANNGDDSEKKNRSLIASIFNNQWNKIKSGIVRDNNKNENSNDPTYVQVLDTGIKVFNTLTGSETYTSKSYNSEGRLTGYQIEGREVLLSRNNPAGSTE